MNHAWGFSHRVLCCTGLARYADPVDLCRLAGTGLDDGLHHAGQRAGLLGVDGLRHLRGLGLIDGVEVGAEHALDEVALMTTLLFATAAEIMATWSGVTRTSY